MRAVDLNKDSGYVRILFGEENMFFLLWKYFCAVSLSHRVKSVRSKWTTLTMGSVLILIMASLSGCAVGKDTDPIDSPPTASFTHSPASPVVGQAVQFTDTSTGSPTSWQWNFGDGTSSTSRNPSHAYATAGTKTVALTVTNGLGSSSASHPVTVVTSSAIIVDHNSTKLVNIPSEWITAAKTNLHIAYGTASHGLQIYYGAICLDVWDGTEKYAFSNGGAGGTLDFRCWPSAGYFGNLNMAISLDLAANTLYNNTIWEAATRIYLDAHPEINVIMWAWCYGADTTVANINLYLSLMSGLEVDYPNVKFVYMTGHANGTSEEGNLHIRNQQIRDYCIANNKILYDFYDIECWDPDGIYYGDKHTNANCDYDSNGDGVVDDNWAVNWQDAHVNGVDWFTCDQAYGCHTQPLNGNLKAWSVWHLFARLAGWDGN
jgi:PKD repeat protein